MGIPRAHIVIIRAGNDVLPVRVEIGVQKLSVCVGREQDYLLHFGIFDVPYVASIVGSTK